MLKADEKAKIIEEFFAQNRQWFELISRNHAPEDSRQDLKQEIRMALWKSLDSYNSSNSSVKTWFYAVARNTAMQFRRRNHDKRRGDARVYADPGYVEQEYDLLQVIEDFMGTLGELDREIFSMFVEGRSYAEISIATGADEANLRKRVSRIKEHFKAIYGS